MRPIHLLWSISMTTWDLELLAVLERARSLGFLGPGPVETQLAHALTHIACVPCVPLRFLDLGAGGGVPGLVAVAHWPGSHAVLIDASERRCRFLVEATAMLGLHDRVTVMLGRAEVLAHDPELRGTFPVVLSRSFGPPAVTAECAAAFLEPGGVLVVSEPPVLMDGRWNDAALLSLGFDPPEVVTLDAVHFAVLRCSRRTDDRFPRRDGVPAKRPLW